MYFYSGIINSSYNEIKNISLIGSMIDILFIFYLIGWIYVIHYYLILKKSITPKNDLESTQIPVDNTNNINENSRMTMHHSVMDNWSDKKKEIFKKINQNEIFHRLVILNQINLLSDLLECLSVNGLIDTIFFELKNKDKNKTPFDIAIDADNSEALFLLNFYQHVQNNNNNSNMNDDSIDWDKLNSKIDKITETKDVKPIEKGNIQNLIFQGGGIKGIAYIGALKEADKQKIFKLSEIQKVAGTSAGAITASLLAVGYKVEDLEDYLRTLDFKEILLDSKIINDQEIKNLFEEFKILSSFNGYLMNLPLLLISNLSLIINSGKLSTIIDTIKKYNGLFEGAAFRKWIDDKIKEKLGENATFKDLQDKINTEGSTNNFKYLFLTGSNLQTGKCDIFSHLHTPNMLISDAVRISMSIPLLFYTHKMKIKDVETKEPIDDPNNNSLYVDGGIFNNYPIRIFDSTINGKNSESIYINKHTLGFRLVSEDLKNNYENFFETKKSMFEDKDKDVEKLSKIFKLLFNYIVSVESFHSDRIKDQERTVYINSLDVSPIDFGINDQVKNELIESGRKGINDFIKRKGNFKKLFLF
jgi:NTE family protein